MPEFSYPDPLPAGADSTEYRLVTAGRITARQPLGRTGSDLPAQIELYPAPGAPDRHL